MRFLPWPVEWKCYLSSNHCKFPWLSLTFSDLSEKDRFLLAFVIFSTPVETVRSSWVFCHKKVLRGRKLPTTASNSSRKIKSGCCRSNRVWYKGIKQQKLSMHQGYNLDGKTRRCQELFVTKNSTRSLRYIDVPIKGLSHFNCCSWRT